MDLNQEIYDAKILYRKNKSSKFNDIKPMLMVMLNYETHKFIDINHSIDIQKHLP